MWVEQTPSGKFKACERYTDPATGKTRKVSVTIDKDTKASRKAAQAALYDKIHAIPDPADYTLRQLADAYLKDKARTIRASTVVVYGCNINGLFSFLPESVKTSQLSAGYVNDKLKASGSAATVNGRIKVFKLLMTWAYENDFIQSREWLNKIKPLKDDKKSRIEDKYLEQDEITALLDAMDNQLLKLVTRFLLLTGLRIGEAIALEMPDIGKEYIHVHRTYRIATRDIGDVPKTADSERDVYIQPELAELLAEIKKYRLVSQLAKGCRSNFVFFGSKGQHLDYQTYLKYLIKMSESVLSHRITPHALRHTHVSILAAQGVSLDVIARRLGHSDDKITKAVYMHVTSKLKERDNAALVNVKVAP